MSWSIEAAFRKNEFAVTSNDIRAWLENHSCDPDAVRIIVQTCSVVLLRIEFASENLAREFGGAFAGNMVARPVYFAS